MVLRALLEHFPMSIEVGWETSDHAGETSHETCPLGARIHLSFYSGCAAPSILSRSGLTSRSAPMLPQFGFSLILLLGPLTSTAGVGSVVSCSQFGLSVFLLLLPSLLILRVTFDPLKECSTDEGYMLS